MKPYPWGSIIVALLLLAGCATRSRSPYVGLSPKESRAVAQQLALDRNHELQDDLGSAFINQPPKNVLILSGGDANGAFGCGILRGWRNSPAGRPKFDVVSGVSTGALMATFAFLGEEQDDITLREVYTTIRDKDIFAGPSSFSSLLDTAPLKRLIAKHVTRDTLCRVATAHREGRRLYVTTVELESGDIRIWPLSKIAFEAFKMDEFDSGALVRFRQVLLASAAIPFFFPPVEIDGGLHFDAGLREAVSLRLFMLGLHATEASTDQSEADKSLTANSPTVWAILNGKLRSSPEAVRNNLVSLGARSLEIYNESVVILSLRDAAHVAATHNPPFQFRWLSEPDELDAGPGPGLFHPMFDPAVTKRLYAAGESLSQAGPGVWNYGPPPLDADSLTQIISAAGSNLDRKRAKAHH